MTTFQDPQPQSRRAVRQSERGDSFETQGQPPQFSPDAAAIGTWDTLARRAAQLPQAPARPDPAAAPGRRAAAPAPTPPAEPLSYSTEGRAATPPGQNPQQPPVLQSFRPRGTSTPPVDPIQAPPAQPSQSSFRTRDFSPEGGRSASPQAWSVAAVPPPAPSGAPSDLDYHTEARLHYEVPVAPGAVPEGMPFEQTLSRRELRAQLATEQQASGSPQPVDMSAAAMPAPAAPAAFPPAPEPKADTALTNAIAEFDALTQRTEASQQDAAGYAARQAQAQAQEAARAAQQEAWASEQRAQQVAAQQAAELQAAELQAQQAAAQQAQQAAWLAQQQAAQKQAASPQDPVQPAQQAAPAVAPQAAPSEPSAWTPPLGHWSSQSNDDDEPYENTINRTVGNATATTSALVISTVPGTNDIRGPLTGTGEIMLTGSIDLPRSFSSTGASARFDPEGIDAFFDAGDAEVISTDSAPVRAIRAVSTHNSGQAVTHTQKPKGTGTLTFLLIAASSMAVIVAGLLVTAFALNIF